MRILLTGATGRVGGAVVDRLVAAGHDLTVIGRREGLTISGGQYIACNVEDYDKLAPLCQGMDAIVHLAAIPDPCRAPGRDVFRVNTAGTFNVYEAAVEAGIRRVVSASSINALGYGYAMQPVEPDYFPIDERHPTHPREAYSLSKNVVEQIGRYFWERFQITSLVLRLPGVMRLSPERAAALASTDLDQLAEGFHALEAMPVPERVTFINEHQRITREGRYEHYQRLAKGSPPVRDPREDDPRWMALSQRGGFWTAMDARDAAQAVECSLLAEVKGSHTLFVNDSQNVLGFDSERMIEIAFPMVRGRTQVLEGAEALVSIQRARHLIGFEPEHHIAEMRLGTPSLTL